MIKSMLRLTMAASLLTFATVNSASAQTELNNRTKMTFSQPVEVPGKVLPAGTYTFEMHDSGMNRHVIEIFDEGGTKLQALVLAIPSYRAKATEETIVKFAEAAPGQPQAIRIWYYPGQTTGNELVYSKSRARELAASANIAVQSTDDARYTDATLDTMKSAEVTVLEPEKKAEPVVIQPEPVQPPPTPAPQPVVAAPLPAPMPAPVREALPHTASTLPLLFLIGGAFLVLGVAIRAVSAKKVTH